MYAESVLCGVGVTCAFVSGALFVRAFFLHMVRLPVVGVASNALLSPRIARLLRNGLAPLAPLARRVLRVRQVSGVVGSLVVLSCQKGFSTTPEALTTALCAVGLCVGAGLFVVSQSVPCGLSGMVLFFVVVTVYAHSFEEKRRSCMREAIPDVLRAMESCFQSGLSLLQTLEHLSREAPRPLRSVFSSAAHEASIGLGTEAALEGLRKAADVPELSFVAVALEVQHRTGGSMQEVLDAARETVEGELTLKRSLRVQTAQAKLSARVVTVLPFALIALFSLMSSDFLTPFFTSAAGVAVLGLALVMQAAGIVAVRRMLSVEVA